MTATPITNRTPCMMRAPVSSRPNRIASAQPPAKAAPKTSAPIRIAAETTVITLGQMIWRDEEDGFDGAMALVSRWGGNLVQKPLPIKRQSACLLEIMALKKPH